MFDKNNLRKEFKAKRKVFSIEKLDYLSNQIFNLFKNSDFINFTNYHIFLPIKVQNEVNTHFIIDFLRNNNKNIIIPKVKNNILEHYFFDSNTKIINNKWGIPEPENTKKFDDFYSLDLVFIPLLISDKSGNRIGYGKGFYDKFLIKLPKKTLKVGINFFSSFDGIFENKKHDVPLDYLISPFKVESFSENLIK